MFTAVMTLFFQPPAAEQPTAYAEQTAEDQLSPTGSNTLGLDKISQVSTSVVCCTRLDPHPSARDFTSTILKLDWSVDRISSWLGKQPGTMQGY